MLNCSNQRRTKKKKKMERQSLFLDRLNIVKLSALSSLIYRVNVPPIKIPASYKLILNIMWKGKRQRIANTILKEKNTVGRLTLPNFRTYYNATTIKTVWHW